MLTRAIYFLTFLAAVSIPLAVGGASIIADPRGLLAIAFGVVWAGVEASLEEHQFARRWSDLAWVAVAIGGIVVAFTAAVFEYAQRTGAGNPLGWITVLGSSISVIGLILRYLSIRTLGEFFTHALQVAKGHRLVESGLYHYLRHPSYLGLALICLGIPLVFESVGVFGLMLVLGTLALVLRILVEEQILLHHFGEEYRVYQRRTKRLLPFVW